MLAVFAAIIIIVIELIDEEEAQRASERLSATKSTVRRYAATVWQRAFSHDDPPAACVEMTATPAESRAARSVSAAPDLGDVYDQDEENFDAENPIRAPENSASAEEKTAAEDPASALAPPERAPTEDSARPPAPSDRPEPETSGD